MIKCKEQRELSKLLDNHRNMLLQWKLSRKYHSQNILSRKDEL